MAFALCSASVLSASPIVTTYRELRTVEGGTSWYALFCPRTLGASALDVHHPTEAPTDPSLDGPLRIDRTHTPPTSAQIHAAIQMESACIFPDPQLLPLTDDLYGNLAVTGYVARHMPARYALSSDADLHVIRALRLLGRFSSDAVYATSCQLVSESYRKVISELIPGPVVAMDTIAWIPLLTPDRELAGLGLLFVYDGIWKYSELTYSLAAPKAYERLVRLIESPKSYAEDEDELFFARCPLPEAPEPELWTEDYSTPWLESFAFKDQRNLLGMVKRLAIRRLASERTPPTSTQLLYAEILLHSLSFLGAPKPGTRIWVSRVLDAQKIFEDAYYRDVDLHRDAPLIRWVGIQYIVGHSGFKQDLTKALRLLKIAAKFGDKEADEIANTFSAGEIGICSDYDSVPLPATPRFPQPESESGTELRPCDYPP